MMKLIGWLIIICLGIVIIEAIWPLLLTAAIIAFVVWVCATIVKNHKKKKVITNRQSILAKLDTLIESDTLSSEPSQQTEAIKPRSQRAVEIEKPQPPQNLSLLLEEDGGSVVETRQQLQEFLDSHVLLRSFITKVVGVSYPNDDGTSRQEILSHCLNGEPVGLYWYTFRGAPACAILSDHGQIGHLKADLAAELHEQFGEDDDIIFSAKISDITGGVDDLYYGCKIMLSIYGPAK